MVDVKRSRQPEWQTRNEAGEQTTGKRQKENTMVMEALWERLRLAVAWLRRAGGEAGDVPGWVLVTAMSVALAVAVWAIAKTMIVAIVTNALTAAKF